MKEASLTSTVLLKRIEVLEEALEEARNVAETDQLTGLPNRRALERRTHARDGWFILADLNGFKRAQDAHPEGHAYGDRVLIEFAEFLDVSCRSRFEDRVSSRLGGDEFVIWCPTRHGARMIKRRVRKWRSRDGRVGAAAGLGKTLEAADAAMYLNKNQ